MSSQEFLRKLAHDLRSPISVIGGYAEARSSGGLSAVDEKHYLEAVRVSVEKLSRLADSVAERVGEGASFGTETPVPFPGGPVGSVGKACAGGSVLIVDDNDGIRFQWRQLLKSETRDIVEARSGEELLGMKIDFSTVIAAVVDYHYEGSDLNGLDVIEYLKRKKIPRVHLCTANYGDVKIRERALALGAASVIPKPIPKIDILKIVRS
jgi:CheY-like chemotaxis protein